MYNCLAYLRVIPHVVFAILLIWAAHFKPLPIVYACCAFQLRLQLKIIPRYLVLPTGFTVICGRCNILLFLLFWLWAKSISASLVCLRGELCILDHSETPPSLHIMCASIQCISVKFSAVAIISVLSTKAIASSFFFLGLSSRLAL